MWDMDILGYGHPMWTFPMDVHRDMNIPDGCPTSISIPQMDIPRGTTVKIHVPDGYEDDDERL